jgi:hypothetical protein
MDTRTKVLGLRTAIIALLVLMPVGSPGDKIALILFALLLTSRKTVHALRDLIRSSSLLTCTTYSAVAIAAAWGNSRYRSNGGPFHLALDHVWQGYPLPYLEWDILIPSGIVWSKSHWTSAVVDALLIGMGVLAARHLIGSSADIPRILTLSIYCAAFVWLNIEVWLYGAPALFFCDSCPWRIPNYVEIEGFLSAAKIWYA